MRCTTCNSVHRSNDDKNWKHSILEDSVRINFQDCTTLRDRWEQTKAEYDKAMKEAQEAVEKGLKELERIKNGR